MNQQVPPGQRTGDDYKGEPGSLGYLKWPVIIIFILILILVMLSDILFPKQ